MVDMDWKTKMMPPVSVMFSSGDNGMMQPVSRTNDLCLADEAAVQAYEQYLRLPELCILWICRDFPDWPSEGILKPAIQGLEITFRFVSLVLSDPRPYVNRAEWKHRLESMAVRQIELIAAILEEDGATNVPVMDISETFGVLARDRSNSEVWKVPGTTMTFVNRTSEMSLLPRLAAWHTSEDLAAKLELAIECQMGRLPFSFGLGEPNLAGKPNFEYDLVCKPADLHALKRCPIDIKNSENQTLFTTHQILECWICAARELLGRAESRIDNKEYEKAASDCWLVERIWKLLSEIEDVHLLMDPSDFLCLKNQLAIRASGSETEAFCFRSKALLNLTYSSKNLKHKVPQILDVEVDPEGGPRVQEAVMTLFHGRSHPERIRLLQAFQAIEGSVKKFFFGYKELLVTVMGSVEAVGNHAFVRGEPSDQLSQIFLEPPYFPSLDAAKTFLAEYWRHQNVTRCDGFR